MKKLSKIFLSLALAFVFVLPLAFVGCNQNTVAAKKLVSVEFVSAIKTDYIVGETLDFNGAKLRLVYDDNSKVLIDPDASMVSGFNTETVGNKNFVLEYDGVQRTVAYTVNNFKLGTYHLYYWGPQNSYTAAAEEEQAAKYLTLNADGTGSVVLTEVLPVTWQYENSKVKVTINNSESYLQITVQSSTNLVGIDSSMLTSENPNIFVYRFAE
ncbi:MAG: bacterial Ig-like domain-containing protein [Clostridia bacterium]|nr:bacterial Ig-like domain-containing protein [Clostridia bacterium]